MRRVLRENSEEERFDRTNGGGEGRVVVGIVKRGYSIERTIFS